MRIRTLCTFTIVAATAFLAGCSGAATTPPNAPMRGADAARSSVLRPWAQPFQVGGDLAPPVITTAQIYHDNLAVYGESGGLPPQIKRITLTFLESITSGISAPQGTVATIGGDWYVTNSGASNVLVYLYNGSTFALIKTLDDAGQQPGDVDTNASQSLVAVSNVGGTSSRPASISLYAHGSTTPTGTLRASDAVRGVGVAIDGKGNCFWSYSTTASVAKIVEFTGCKGSPKPLSLSPALAGGLAFDRVDNLYYADPGAAKVYRCTGTLSCNAFKQTFVGPVFINFDQGWKHLWVADFLAATIYGIDTKSGKTISTTPAVGGSSDPPLGIAPIPGSKF